MLHRVILFSNFLAHGLNVGESENTKTTWTDGKRDDDVITKKSQMERSYAEVVRGKG